MVSTERLLPSLAVTIHLQNLKRRIRQDNLAIHTWLQAIYTFGTELHGKTSDRFKVRKETLVLKVRKAIQGVRERKATKAIKEIQELRVRTVPKETKAIRVIKAIKAIGE